MKEFTYTIKDKDGLHARPAGILVKNAKCFVSNVSITKDDQTADMKALIKVMSMAIKQGTTVKIRVDGPDEEECAKALKECFENNL